jgi:hypothetical protein
MRGQADRLQPTGIDGVDQCEPGRPHSEGRDFIAAGIEGEVMIW